MEDEEKSMKARNGEDVCNEHIYVKVCFIYINFKRHFAPLDAVLKLVSYV